MQTNGKKRDVATDAIRRLVLFKYQPGDCLSEAQLVADLEEEYSLRVSRTPIRHAVSVLEAEGLISVKPKQGTIVRYITPREVAEIQSARLANELWCVSKLAQGFADGKNFDLAEPTRVLREMKTIAAKKKRRNEADENSFCELDLEFHCKLAVAAGYETTIYPFLRQLRSRFMLIAEPGAGSFSDSTVKEHNQILMMIRRGCVKDARSAMRKHLGNAKRRWQYSNASVQ